MAILVDDPGTLVDDPDVSVNGSLLAPEDPGYIPGTYNATAPRTLPTYELVLVERTPNLPAAASYVEVGQLLAPTITWTDVLNGDGTLSCSTSTNRLDADVKQALRDYITPDGAPTGLELLLYRDGTPVWRGPLVGGQVQGVTAVGRPQIQRSNIVCAEPMPGELVQGLAHYRSGANDTTGLMHHDLGGYRPEDIRVVAAWDVDRRKEVRRQLGAYERVHVSPEGLAELWRHK